MSKFGSGVNLSDWEKKMCQLYIKGAQDATHQSYRQGQGQYEPKGQHLYITVGNEKQNLALNKFTL
jgi:hypothetical protein